MPAAAMTAAPYFERFEMSDGSERRPIVERVPACFPKQLERDHACPCCEYDALWRGALDDASGVSAALCRVAVEIWLIANVGEIRLANGPDPNNPNTVAFEHADATRMAGSGASMHHALIIAAHLVADVNGVPH
jgi:hypothetical protein